MSIPRIAKIAAATLAAAAVTVTGAPTASATTTITAPGSILYVKNNDVWLTDSTATHVTRVTTNGSTQTADDTGGVGYHAPSQPDNGAYVVAVRNQTYSPGYDQGWIWVMNRDGSVIRTFKPPQFALITDPSRPCAVKADQVPRGIISATVSPDGKHLAYTAWTYEQLPDCTVGIGYSTYIVAINGTGAHQIARSDGDAADLENGRWVNNKQLLLDDVDFGSVAFWSVTLPSYTAQHWTDAPDYLDAAYSQPALKRGKLASTSYSEYASDYVLRLWTSTGPPADPVAQCEYPVSNLVSGAFAGGATWAPNASAVAWNVDDDNDTVRRGEGIYVVKVGATLTCRAKPQLLVAGGFEPSWSAAAA